MDEQDKTNQGRVSAEFRASQEELEALDLYVAGVEDPVVEYENPFILRIRVDNPCMWQTKVSLLQIDPWEREPPIRPKKGVISARREMEEQQRRSLDFQVANITEVPKRIRSQFLDRVNLLSGTIRDFLLMEILPASLAFQSGVEQTAETASIILDQTIKKDSINYREVERIFEDALQLKAINFLATTLKLDAKTVATLISYYGSRSGRSGQPPNNMEALLRMAARASRPGEDRG